MRRRGGEIASDGHLTASLPHCGFSGRATRNRRRRKPMSPNQPDIGAALRKSVHDHWRMFLIEGIVLVILGLAAVALPPLAGIATAVVLGWLFLCGGIVGLIATFGQRHAPGFW